MKNHVRALREARGLSQTQLAASLGVGQTIISRIEIGKQPMTDRQMGEIARILKVHPVELIDDPAWNRPPPSSLDESLLISVVKVIIRLMKKHSTMNENTAAEVMASLYRRFASHKQADNNQDKQIEDTADILVAHEMSKRY